MNDKNCELLFEYLRSILYDSHIQPLDLEQLDEPFRKLGRGMQILQTLIEEIFDYSMELSNGNLSVEPPSKENLLCTNLKNIHATLNHLTWQAKQVALGDYSQKVSYLGEFSSAFNTLTEQLKEREAKLLHEAVSIKQRSEALAIYNELLLKMADNPLEWIFVVDACTGNIIYCNKALHSNDGFVTSPCANCTNCNPYSEEISEWSGNANEVWEIHTDDNKYFQINSYPITWNKHTSYVHVVSDITTHKLEENLLSKKAYLDPITSIHNRMFFEERMKKILRKKTPVTLGYMDLDGLKFVNDNYGHIEGDRYISEFAALIKDNFRTTDVFARIGGDEFCLVLCGSLWEETCQKLELIRTKLITENTKPYPVSFSYGVHVIDNKSDRRTLHDIMKEADSRMYEYKRLNKIQRK